MTLRAALRSQARSCAELGSDFTACLMELLADRLQHGAPLTDRLLNWSGDLTPTGQSVPLRLAGALHGLVLDGACPGLAACYPPNDADDDRLWGAILTAMAEHPRRIDRWLDRPPQTNEVGRSAVLIAAGHWLSAEIGRPLVLSELGASAGLNLHWDRYGLQIGDRRWGPQAPALTLNPDWQGAPPPRVRPRDIDRRGVDLTPLNPRDPADALRLLAYVWPDQPDRLSRIRAALQVAEAPVDQGDAADWLQSRLAAPQPGACHLIYHTVAWQYFPPAVQAQCRTLIEQAGRAATDQAPLAWLGMEADAASPGAGLTLRLWPGERRLSLGRADFHGRWLRWDPRPA